MAAPLDRAFDEQDGSGAHRTEGEKMKLTKNIRAVILRQFCANETIEYLADLYGFSKERIEDLIREELISQREANLIVKELKAPGASPASAIGSGESVENAGKQDLATGSAPLRRAEGHGGV